MNRRAFSALLALLAGLVILALVLSMTGREPDAGELLLPELRAQLNDIDQMIISTAGGASIATLKRSDERWLLAERSDYPANLVRLRQLLLALSEARLLEAKTANPALHERLGVEDLERADARGTGISLYRDGEQLAGFIIGDSPASGQHYVRHRDQAQSWLAAADLAPGRHTRDWLEPLLMDIPASRIATVQISHPDGEEIELVRDSGGFGMVVTGLPPGRSLRHATVADGIGGVLGALELDDVTPAPEQLPGPDEVIHSRFASNDGLLIEALSHQVDDGWRTRFVVGSSEAASAAVRTEAEELGQRMEGWLYTLPTFKSEQLTRRLEQLLAPPEEDPE